MNPGIDVAAPVRIHVRRPSPDGKTLAAGINLNGGYKAVIRLWSLPGYQERPNLQGHTDRFWALAFSPDSRLLASGGEDKVVKSWDMATGVKARPDLSVGSPVFGLAMIDGNRASKPWGNALAVASAAGLQFYDRATGQPCSGNMSDGGAITAVAFSADGKLWTAGSAMGNLMVQGKGAKGDHHFAGQKSPIFALAFSPDGNVLAAANDQTIWLQDVSRIHSGRTAHFD